VGDLPWSWDTMLRDRSDPAWKLGKRQFMVTDAANVWAQISVDPEPNLVFVNRWKLI